ncbi:hypothetical protein C8Q80DRAFT_1192599 [Daedaleopsis nitida]|nr:hypothetical protein C8Q80DRAFT_1192599 [Daedaleopsis nitida]
MLRLLGVGAVLSALLVGRGAAAPWGPPHAYIEGMGAELLTITTVVGDGHTVTVVVPVTVDDVPTALPPRVTDIGTRSASATASGTATPASSASATASGTATPASSSMITTTPTTVSEVISATGVPISLSLDLPTITPADPPASEPATITITITATPTTVSEVISATGAPISLRSSDLPTITGPVVTPSVVVV